MTRFEKMMLNSAPISNELIKRFEEIGFVLNPTLNRILNKEVSEPLTHEERYILESFSLKVKEGFSNNKSEHQGNETPIPHLSKDLCIEALDIFSKLESYGFIKKIGDGYQWKGENKMQFAWVLFLMHQKLSAIMESGNNFNWKPIIETFGLTQKDIKLLRAYKSKIDRDQESDHSHINYPKDYPKLRKAILG